MLTQKAHQAKHKYRDNFLSRQILQHQFSWRTKLITKHYSSLKVTHTAESFTRHQLCIFWSQSKHIPSFLPSPATAVSQQCWCHWLHVYQLPPDTERWCICAVPQEHHNMRTSPAFREMHLVSFYSFQLHQLDWLCPSFRLSSVIFVHSSLHQKFLLDDSWWSRDISPLLQDLGNMYTLPI